MRGTDNRINVGQGLINFWLLLLIFVLIVLFGLVLGFGVGAVIG